jgi:hypothetical protein
MLAVATLIPMRFLNDVALLVNKYGTNFGMRPFVFGFAFSGLFY